MRVVAGKVAEMAVVSVIKVLTTGMRETASYNLTHRSIRSSRPVARAFLLVALVLQRVAASVRGVVVAVHRRDGQRVRDHEAAARRRSIEFPNP